MGSTDEFSFAKESVTQVITLASGILGLSLTFAKDWASSATPGDLRLLKWSWIGFLASITFGLWSLLAITGLIGEGKTSTKDWGLRIPWMGEIVTFVGSLALFTSFGFKVL